MCIYADLYGHHTPTCIVLILMQREMQRRGQGPECLLQVCEHVHCVTRLELGGHQTDPCAGASEAHGLQQKEHTQPPRLA